MYGHGTGEEKSFDFRGLVEKQGHQYGSCVIVKKFSVAEGSLAQDTQVKNRVVLKYFKTAIVTVPSYGIV
ncbi:MAG: hypothetical protein R2759_00565 [Bacteroidales bacterium]